VVEAPDLHGDRGRADGNVDVSRILIDQRGPVRIRLCVETTCSTTARHDDQPLDAVFVDDASIQGTEPVLVGLSVSARAGVTVSSTKTSVTLSRIQPNGPDRPPTVYATSLVATTQDGLQPGTEDGRASRRQCRGSAWWAQLFPPETGSDVVLNEAA
jgi:hypothetical protein